MLTETHYLSTHFSTEYIIIHNVVQQSNKNYASCTKVMNIINIMLELHS
jgi:hypothetical protein